MKTIKYLYITLLVALCAVACDDKYDGETYVLYETQPASTYLSTRPDDFSEWIAIMKYADLYNAVNQATQYFTVFVPNNDAVKAFYQKKGVSSIQDLGEEYAKTLVKYHLIKDTINQTTFISTEGEIEKKTVSDDYLSVSYQDGGLNAIYLNKEGRVLEFANKVSNGYVYVLENVLSPMVESVYERMADNASFSIFTAALDATGLGAKINVISEMVENKQGIQEEQRRYFTVLGVTNDAFKAAGIDDLNGLVSKLGASNDYTNESNALYQYVAYHIISGSYPLSKLKTFDAADANSKIWNTLSTEGLIKISERNDGFYLNYQDENSRTTFLEDDSDLQAKNGYVHQLAGYMPIAEPEPETVKFDVTDLEAIKNLVDAGKGVSDSNMKYQTVGTAEYNCDLSEADIYEYKGTSSSFKHAFGTGVCVNYFTPKTSSAWAEASNCDYLLLSLGYNGWISFKTPTILKGKYKVSIGIGYATTMEFIRTASDNSNGGEMKFTIDGDNEVACKPYSVVPSKTLGNYEAVIYDEVQFTSTGSHTVKLVMNDPVASTNSNYRIMIDYILFTPIFE